MILLRFRHDSQTSEWRFDGIDEPALRRMLQELGVYSAERGSAEAVLEAEDVNGTSLGSWTRGGAAHLASVMFRERQTPPWSDVEEAIQAAVMDPHADEAAPA